jgi:Flp pilus assembly pilin Flp
MRGLAWISAFITTVLDPQSTKKDERGAAFTEYVALIALVVAGMVGVLALLWPALSGVIADAIAGLP